MSVVETIIDDALENLNPRTGNYEQDVMSPEQWYWGFDEWTRNFVNTYMKPEWEKEVYTPQMRQLNQGLSGYNKQAGNSGAWRSTMFQKNLANMAQDAINQEEKMKKEFAGKAIETRDAIRASLADPLYEQNMKRWYDSPMGEVSPIELPEGVPGDLDSVIEGIKMWDPSVGEVPTVDWSIKPNSVYKPTLFNQYYTGKY